jgi:hypothetical protein
MPHKANYWLRVFPSIGLAELIKKVRSRECGVMAVICKIFCVNEAKCSVERACGILR